MERRGGRERGRTTPCFGVSYDRLFGFFFGLSVCHRSEVRGSVRVVWRLVEDRRDRMVGHGAG